MGILYSVNYIVKDQPIPMDNDDDHDDDEDINRDSSEPQDSLSYFGLLPNELVSKILLEHLCLYRIRPPTPGSRDFVVKPWTYSDRPGVTHTFVMMNFAMASGVCRLWRELLFEKCEPFNLFPMGTFSTNPTLFTYDIVAYNKIRDYDFDDLAQVALVECIRFGMPALLKKVMERNPPLLWEAMTNCFQLNLYRAIIDCGDREAAMCFLLHITHNRNISAKSICTRRVLDTMTKALFHCGSLSDIETLQECLAIKRQGVQLVKVETDAENMKRALRHNRLDLARVFYPAFEDHCALRPTGSDALAFKLLLDMVEHNSMECLKALDGLGSKVNIMEQASVYMKRYGPGLVLYDFIHSALISGSTEMLSYVIELWERSFKVQHRVLSEYGDFGTNLDVVLRDLGGCSKEIIEMLTTKFQLGGDPKGNSIILTTACSSGDPDKIRYILTKVLSLSDISTTTPESQKQRLGLLGLSNTNFLLMWEFAFVSNSIDMLDLLESLFGTPHLDILRRGIRVAVREDGIQVAIAKWIRARIHIDIDVAAVSGTILYHADLFNGNTPYNLAMLEWAMTESQHARRDPSTYKTALKRNLTQVMDVVYRNMDRREAFSTILMTHPNGTVARHAFVLPIYTKYYRALHPQTLRMVEEHNVILLCTDHENHFFIPPTHMDKAELRLLPKNTMRFKCPYEAHGGLIYEGIW